ncbi:MAG: prepilin peptidase [Pseudomonadota bacterium]
MPSLIFLAVFPAALMVAAANDLYDFKIPNWISLALIVSYALAGIVLGAPLASMVEGILLGCAVLAVGFGLFAAKLLGGGDAKLLAATAPWIGLAEFFNFAFTMVIAGGVLTLFLLLFRKMPILPVYAHANWILRMHENRKDLPYGVAIAAGGLLTFDSTPYFQIAFGG